MENYHSSSVMNFQVIYIYIEILCHSDMFISNKKLKKRTQGE